jgi:purine-binding chemotaxis protein CheW
MMEKDQTHIPPGEDTESPGKMELLQELKESDPSAREEPHCQIVLIAFDGEYYGINILSVLEILKVPKITWLPCSPDYIAGVISLRGNIQSVVNLKAFLKLGDSHITEQSRIILVESGELVTGLLVDEMLDILDVPENAMLPLTEQAKNLATHYLEGKLRWNERTMTILHIEAIVQAVVVDQQ